MLERTYESNGITESNKLKDNETFTVPGKNHNCIEKNVNLYSFQRSTLHNIVYNFHTTHKKLPCLRLLLRVLKTEHPELGLEFTHETFQKTNPEHQSLDLTVAITESCGEVPGVSGICSPWH